MMVPKLVEPNELTRYWPASSAWLHRGLLPSQGEMDIDQLHGLLAQGLLRLIVGLDGQDVIAAAMVVQFIEFPNIRIAHVLSIGGRDLLSQQQAWQAVLGWMRRCGAARVQGYCQPAQARLWSRLGFKPAYQIMQLPL